MSTSRSDDTSDRVIRDASALLDALDRGYLGPSDRADMTTEWTGRLRRSLEAHRIAGIGERVAAVMPSERPDHSEAEAA